MLIKVRKRKVASLPLLFRLVLKHIYEPQNMSLEEEEFMQRSFIGWHNKSFKNEDELYHLRMMAGMVQDNADGKFEQRKALFKEHGIDYRQFHRLPESCDYSKDNLARIAEIARMEQVNHEWRHDA
jgi:hypothetical protein